MFFFFFFFVLPISDHIVNRQRQQHGKNRTEREMCLCLLFSSREMIIFLARDFFLASCYHQYYLMKCKFFPPFLKKAANWSKEKKKKIRQPLNIKTNNFLIDKTDCDSRLTVFWILYSTEIFQLITNYFESSSTKNID